MSATTTPPKKTAGAKLFGLLGACAILAGLLLNEWVTARLFAPDGALSPRSLLLVRAADAALIVTGLGLVVLRMRLARLISMQSELAALAFGCAVAATLLACVEIPLYFVNNAREKNPALDRTYTPGFMSPHPLLGRRPMPSARYAETATLLGEPLFSVSYKVGPDRCRIVPVQPAQHVDKALLFFGCSFTFGTGVEDHQTLPNQAAALMPDTRVYNFAGVGDGPHHMLAQLTQTDIRNSVGEDNATVVYVFIPQHLPRSIAGMRHAHEWGRNDPAFKIGPDGAAQYLGPVEKAYPWRVFVYDMLCCEQILRRLNADWPLAIMERHIQYNARLVAAAQEECSKKFNNARFFVLFHPLSSRLHPTLGVDWDRVKEVFEQNGLRVLDYRSLAAPDESDLFYVADEHPTAKMHARTAARLAQDLAAEEKKGSPAL